MVLLGYLFLGEKLSVNSIFLISIIVIAGIFASMDEKFSLKSFFTKKIALGIFFMLVLSGQSFFVNRAVSQNDYWTTTLWIGLLSILFSFVILLKSFYKDFLKSKMSDYYGVMLLSLFGGIGDLAAYKAFSGNVGISSVIISLPISMVFVFCSIFLETRFTRKTYPKSLFNSFCFSGNHDLGSPKIINVNFVTIICDQQNIFLQNLVWQRNYY